MLTPTNTQFAIISFEGPDEYARAGGLAVRVRDLCEALSSAGFQTHLFFIGDPRLPAVEEHGNLVLHRWAQWVSAYHPAGVYDGEWGKMQDLTGSLPPFLINALIRPAAEQGRTTVLMGEDWQTAPAMIATGHLLHATGLDRYTIPVWTANNLYGFHEIDLQSLTQAATTLTVSRYMKHQMWEYGLDPLVTPNGISPSAMVEVSGEESRLLRDAFSVGAESRRGPPGRASLDDVVLFKIGRFSPDKRWIMALEAVALLKRRGVRARLLIRGDKLPYGGEVLALAQAGGLQVESLGERYHSTEELAAAIRARPNPDILNLAAFLPDDLLPPIYAAADGVMANSGHEPFGLVGLEVMAAGGLAYVGSTGEDYAEPQRNAVVLDTDDPWEIVVHVLRLRDMPEEVARLKAQGKETARAYLWPQVIKELFAKLEYVALTRGVELRP